MIFINKELFTGLIEDIGDNVKTQVSNIISPFLPFGLKESFSNYI